MATFSSNLPHIPQALVKACVKAGLEEGHNDKKVSAPLVLFEAGESANASLNAEEAAALIENLRTGGRLLYTSNPFAGRSAFWLSSVLPSTGWTTVLRPTPYTSGDPIEILGTDEKFFDRFDIKGLRVPSGFDIRPTSAVERGQARYERYSMVHPVLRTEVLAGSDLWSRSLLNREWTVRARYENFMHLPLLVTGRYGAGRVAMLATNAPALGESVQAQAFWRAVLCWLLEAEDATAATIPLDKPTLEADFSSSSSVRVTLTNPSTEAVPVQLVLRILDQNGAILPDGEGEVQRALTLPPGKPTIVEHPLPHSLISGIELFKAEKIFQIRAGLLSVDGSTLFSEQRFNSMPPPISLRVETDNLYSVPYPFHAPGPDSITRFRGRMGFTTGAYSYMPGSILTGTAVLSYQNTNLAPLADIRDLTQPKNASVIALNDHAAGLNQPFAPDKIQGYGTWNGKSGVENVLQLTLPLPSKLVAITLIGSFGPYRSAELHNPGSAVIEIDGHVVATVVDLDSAFAASYGKARVPFTPMVGTVVTVRLPWIGNHGSTSRLRSEPWLGEILLEGWPVDLAIRTSVRGQFAVDLVDALSEERLSLFAKRIELHSTDMSEQRFTIKLPNGTEPGVFRLEASFRSSANPSVREAVSAPVLVINPKRTLRPFADLSPPDVFGTALVVTNGFTMFFPLATGTSEQWGGWGHPDDLVWAYSRQMKEIRNFRPAANRLYATESDMRHYSTPWREFPNGDLFFPSAISGLVDHLRTLSGWKAAPVVQVTFADRWVVGPDLNSCNSWQEYVAFDSHLRETTGRRLAGLTHAEVQSSIHSNYESEWQAWQLERYVRSVRSVREAFRAAGKDMFIYSQGFPMVAGELGRELAQTIRGMNDDFTWGMQDNSPTLTTGRNLGEVAFNPVWQITTLMPWGFVSPVFNNWQWHTPVGTTEPSRRLLYNRTWRGMIWDDGRYGAIATYGYTTNVGVPYTMTEEEYQHWWYVQERGSLLQPEAPLGVGLVISTQKNADPRSIRFNCDDATTMAEPRLLMQAFRSLYEAGLSLPFAANASTLGSWTAGPNTSLIVLNLQDFSETELSSLGRQQEKGVRMAAFAQRSALVPEAAALFSRENTLLIERSPAGLSHSQALEIANQLLPILELPLRFPPGTAGYGFRCQDISLIVVEDWLEKARAVTVKLRKALGARHATASNMNDHSTLSIVDGGEFWNIFLPLRSADGVLIAVREV